MSKPLYAFFLIFLFYLPLNAQSVFPKREVRSAWIATVNNIDWPDSSLKTSGEQIAALVHIFNKFQEAGINTVFFQVRTECDALYQSSYEPWSYWLTGKQGRAPDPFFDPLAFAIKEAHARGMELQAWFNPYRAIKEVGDYETAAGHITQTHPDWILDFGKYKMLNPGLPQVTRYIVKIVMDVVQRYDIDGIHFDDYFYPYNPHITNEDSATFEKYKDNFTSIDDWRRNNVNHMIAAVYKAINLIKPGVKFGVSPFGIVENKYAGTHGYDSYDEIYCDPLNWLKNKTVDYVIPQLYWKIGNKAADYKTLVKWWSTVMNGRQLYIGQYSNKMMSPSWKGPASEIGDEVRLNRKTKNVSGEVFFSARSIVDNYSGFIDTLKSLYPYPALQPVMEWKDSIDVPSPVNLKVKGNGAYRTLEWEMPDALDPFDRKYNYVIYRFKASEGVNINNPAHILYITHNGEKTYQDPQSLKKGIPYIYVVTAIDYMQKESDGYAKHKIYIP